MPAYGHGNFLAPGDAGHCLPFEQPGIFKRATLDWLAESRAAITNDRKVDP